MIRKLSLAILLFCAPLFAMDTQKGAVLALTQAALTTRNIQGPVGLSYNGQRFVVESQDGCSPVENYNVDVLLRGRSVEELAKFAAVKRFQVSQLGDGEYRVSPACELKGGGSIGAAIGVFLGQVVVRVPVAIGATIVAIPAGVAGGAVAGPAGAAAAYAATWKTVNTAAQIAVTPIANAASIAGGVALGTVTGPV